MSPSKRVNRAKNLLQHSELYTVPSEKGGYMKVCARRRKKGRVLRVGTFARLPLGTLLNKTQMQKLVRASIEMGEVLKMEEASRILLADALEVACSGISNLGDSISSSGHDVRLPAGVAGQTVRVTNNGPHAIRVHPTNEIVPSKCAEVFLCVGDSWRVASF